MPLNASYPRPRVLLLIASASLLSSSANAQQPQPMPVSPAASAAPAEPVPPAAEEIARAQAKARFDRGIERLQAKAWDAAFVEFVASRQAYPTKSATQNAVVCLRELGRFDEALDMLELLLREFPTLSDAEKSRVAKEMDDVRKNIGTIEIRTVEVNAQISVDGRARGTTPLSAPLRVAAGSHYVRVYKDGFTPFETRAEVPAESNVPLPISLVPLRRSGRLVVSEREAQPVDVLIDGVAVGKAPWSGQVDVGAHTVTLRGEGNIGTAPSAIEVRAGEVATLKLEAGILDAELRIEPTPANALIAIDGVTVGRGIWDGRIKRGEHQVEAGAEGFIPFRQKIVIPADGRTTVRSVLERDPTSSMWRVTVPPAFFFELSLGAGLSPSLGGDLEGGGVVFGGIARANVGYRLGSGLGFGLQAGYGSFGQSFDSRGATLKPEGLPVSPGTAKDDLRLRSALIGVSGELHRTGDKYGWTARLGLGLMLGALEDTRAGVFTNTAAPGNPTYPVGPVSESPDARFFYLAPEVNGFYRVAKNLELGVGITALLGLALSKPMWTDQQRVAAGNCTGTARPPQCLGAATFGNESLTGGALFMLLPHLIGRYELR
jgi:hypothetical protein